MAKYYDFLNHGIEWKDKPNINGHGFVTFDNLPFWNARDAVKYLMEKHPNIEPSWKAIKEDPSKCHKLAFVLLPEVERLRESVQALINQNDNVLKSKAEQRDSIVEIDLKAQIDKELLQEQVHEKVGTSSGLHSAWTVLHNRIMELHQCLGLPVTGGGSE